MIIKKNNISSIKLIKYYKLINYNLIYNNKAINRYKKNSFEISVDKASNLKKLKKSIAEIRNCTLKKNAKNIVFSDGNPKSKIMLIGEAPGAEEDRQGRPFCGASGQLLDKMLLSINLDRNNVYITNVIPWRPPGNRTPTENEIHLMKPFLIRHIEIVSPKILVTVGGSSAKAVLNINGGILRHRGLWKELELSNGKKVPTIATLHPAYLMRAPNQKKLAWEDLKSLRSKIQNL
jgi:DNA polymerase